MWEIKKSKYGNDNLCSTVCEHSPAKQKVRFLLWNKSLCDDLLIFVYCLGVSVYSLSSYLQRKNIQVLYCLVTLAQAQLLSFGLGGAVRRFLQYKIIIKMIGRSGIVIFCNYYQLFYYKSWRYKKGGFWWIMNLNSFRSWIFPCKNTKKDKITKVRRYIINIQSWSIQDKTNVSYKSNKKPR